MGDLRVVAPVVKVRRSHDGDHDEHPWPSAAVEWLGSALPWRTFRWHHGQKHYSGTYWSATNQDHVIYESRLELSCLLQADFDGSVRRIVAQPFLLTAVVRCGTRKHVPDYLLLTDTGPVVVDVKPEHRASKPEIAFTFAWTREAIEARGWKYEVWSGAPHDELENIRFLAGYRRAWLFEPRLLGDLRKVDLDGATLGQACGCLPGWSAQVVRAAVLHMLWCGHLTTDLSRPLSADHVLTARAA